MILQKKDTVITINEPQMHHSFDDSNDLSMKENSSGKQIVSVSRQKMYEKLRNRRSKWTFWCSGNKRKVQKTEKRDSKNDKIEKEDQMKTADLMVFL